LDAVRRGDLGEDEELTELLSISPGRGNTGGIRAAAAALGVANTTLQRDIAIASLTPEQRASARPNSPLQKAPRDAL
jgi:hypothetical protein